MKIRFVLVFKFVLPKYNLSLIILLSGKDLPVLEWTRRVKIAIGAAKGLAYLHEDCKYYSPLHFPIYFLSKCEFSFFLVKI